MIQGQDDNNMCNLVIESWLLVYNNLSTVLLNTQTRALPLQQKIVFFNMARVIIYCNIHSHKVIKPIITIYFEILLHQLIHMLKLHLACFEGKIVPGIKFKKRVWCIKLYNCIVIIT